MKVTISSQRLQLEHPPEDQRRLTNGFIVLYGVVAAVALVWTGLFEREFFVPAVGATVALAFWAWWIRRRLAAGVPWTFSVTPEELRHHDTQRERIVRRAQVDCVEVSRRALGRAGVVAAIEARNLSGEEVLALSVPAEYQEMVEAALEELGWMPERP